MNQFRPVTMIASTTPGTHNPRISAQTVTNRLREIGERPPYTIRDFFAILGRGPRAFEIGKTSAVNHYFGKFSKQTRTAFLVSLKTKLAITHTIAIKLKENRMKF